MGRSVSVPNDAVEVFYLDWMLDEDDLAEALAESLEINDATDICRHDKEQWAESIQSDEFDMLLEDLRLNVFGQFPSVTEADRWLDNEDHVIAENRLAAFGVSEYCGLAAIWVVARRNRWGEWDDDTDVSGLALHWISQAWPKVEAMFPNRLGLMGRFSNGEAVYQRTEREEA